jgi:hypothetical protein
VLPDGRVLVAGGYRTGGYGQPTAEIYDPATGLFTATGSMHDSRALQNMTLLNNGLVLVAGGIDANGNSLSTAEIYDPAAGVFTYTGPMTVARLQFTATLLNGGQVLVAGGNGPLASAEIYDPGSGRFTATGSMSASRYWHTATLLTSGQVLIAGGSDANSRALSATELYDPALGTFSAGTALQKSRSGATATLLSNGSVLVAGGTTDTTAEIYWPPAPTPATLSSIAVSAVQVISVTGQKPTQSYQAMGTYANGSRQMLQGVVWSTADPTVAAISNDESDRGVAFETTIGSTNVTACAGIVCGSVPLSAIFLWTGPADNLFHGTELLQWVVGGVSAANTTVDVVASGNESLTIGSSLNVAASVTWDTTQVPNGRYEVDLIFRDAGGNVLQQLPRNVLVNNSNSVSWHSGTLHNSETWSATQVHVIEATLIIPAGVYATEQHTCKRDSVCDELWS